jgi:TonB family protein
MEQQRQKAPTREEQVIETVKPDVEIAPDHARFVSEYNQKVDRETVARGTNREDIARKPGPEQLEAKPDPREASTTKPPEPGPRSDHPDAPPVPGKLSMRAPGVAVPSEIASDAHRRGTAGGADEIAADGLRARRGDGLIDQREVRPDETRGAGGAGGGGAPPIDLRPSREVLERAIGGGSVDHVEDVAEGDENAYNSRQWIHAGFFNRMKRRVHQTWDPISLWRRHDPNGTVYGARTRVTRVRVSLKPDGALAKIIVIQPSGVDLLDDEAMRAFREAQPFPHPPGALVGADGFITFDFGFHLEIAGGRTEWQIFR